MDKNTTIILRACGKGDGMVTEVTVKLDWGRYSSPPPAVRDLSEELSVLIEPIFDVDHEVKDGSVLLTFCFDGDDNDIIKWRIILYCMRQFLYEGMDRLYRN